MEKFSFRSFAGKLRHAKRTAKAFAGKHPISTSTGVGSSVGGYLGYLRGRNNEKKYPKDVKKGSLPGRLKATAQGALGGAAIGASFHLGKKPSKARVRKHYQAEGKKHWDRTVGSQASSIHVPTPSWAKGAKTKADAKKHYRTEAMKHHPDRGGNAETMKKINTEWEAWEKSPGFKKLSHVLLGLIDELEKMGVKLPSALTAPPPHQMPVVSQPKTPIRGKITISPMMEQGSASATGPQSTDPMV